MVNSLRTHYFQGKNLSDNKSIIINKNNNVSPDKEINTQLSESNDKLNIVYKSKILNLIIYRWVGIESLLIISKNSEKLNFNFFKRV